MYVNSGSDWNRLQVLPYRVDLAGHTMTTRDDSLSTQGEIKSPDGRVNAVAEGEAEPRPVPPQRRKLRSQSGNGGQGSLFG